MLTFPRWLSLCAVGIVAASLAASSAGAPLTPKPKTGKPSKVAYILEKMASDAAKDRGAGHSAAHLSNGVVHATSDGALDVAIWSRDEISGRERGELARLGIKIETAVSRPAEHGKPPLGLVQALVPYDQLDALAALDWVGAVTPPDYGNTDAVTSEGVAFHNADDVQARGINGAGVNVGVISDGVTTIASAVASGDLPNNVNVLNAGSGDEGTAMLEIVNDMAPGAGLLFDSGTGGVAGHVAAQTNLVTNGANVITEDKAFDQEPAFQQGAAASGAEGIAAGNVSFHSSAGNQAQRHAARVAATGTGGGPDGTTGPYTNCSFTPDNVVAIAPGNDTTFDVTLGQDSNGNGATFVLQWSEPRAIFPTAGEGGFTDLDLYVMNSSLTQCLGQSVAVQGFGLGDTMEVVSLPGNLSGTAAKIVVDVAGVHNAVATPFIDLRWRNATSVDTPTRAGSLNPDSNYTGQATSEAALDAQNAGAIEPYSSGGPVQLISTTVCTFRLLGICLAEGAGANQTVPGPTWAAADDVTVSGVGGFGSPFTGTSAATPHGAGCDALLRDSLNNASTPVATTNARLAATAIDIAPAGQDNVTGFGQLDCLAAVNHPPVADAGGPYTTVEGTDATLDGGTGSSDPDTGDSITYAWDFNNDGVYDDATGASPKFTAVGQDGVYPVALQVTDTAGVTATDATTVTVTNVPPTVGAITTTAPKDENSAVEISGSITDPGWLDPLTATINFDDGTGVHPLLGTVENVRPDASLTYDLFHTWGDNGTYTVEICAADDDTSGNCLTTNVQVDNVKPTATIGAAGTTLVNGVPTFITHAGQSVAFSGNSVDPGSDDLTLTWDWGDGGVSPDTSTVYLVNPPNADPAKSPSIQPRNVTEPQSHAFGSACLYTITFASLDDDAGSTSQTATVIVTGNATKNRSAGYWYNQYRDRKASQFSNATLTCYLQIVAYMSKVFPEITNAGTIALATAVLNPPTMKTTVAQQFDRQLLAAWLNFANGSIELGSPVDTNGDGINDSTFVAAVTAAETVRIGPASAAALNAQKTILERINLRDGG